MSVHVRLRQLRFIDKSWKCREVVISGDEVKAVKPCEYWPVPLSDSYIGRPAVVIALGRVAAASLLRDAGEECRTDHEIVCLGTVLEIVQALDGQHVDFGRYLARLEPEEKKT